MTKFALTCLLALLLTGCFSAPPATWTIFQRKAATTPAADDSPPPPSRSDDEKEGDGSLPTEEELLVSKDLLDPPSPPDRQVDERKREPVEDGRPPVNFELNLQDHERVDEFVRHFTDSGSVSFQRRLERSGRFVPLMRKIFAEEGLPEDLVYLAMIESGFQEHALSWAQASGPWQFIESTGRLYGLKNDAWRDERRDPVKSTRAAACHLKDLYRQFGDWYLALAAYNAGAGRVQQAMRATGSSDFWTISRGNSLHSETQRYVPKFLASLKIVREPGRYGFEDVSYQDPLAFDIVTVRTATDLEVIAHLCNTRPEEIRALNPELKRWCTPPGVGNYQVRIPPGTAQRFKKRYAALPEDQRGRFKRHKVKKGETLLGIAGRYNLSTGEIMALNRLSSPRLLKSGATLILPLPEGGTSVPGAESGKKRVQAAPGTYVVRRGDTVYRIARSFGVSESELKAWNGLGSKGFIRPGQKLLLAQANSPKTQKQPDRKTIQRAPRQGAVKKVVRQRAAKGRKVVYQVRSGDTFWDVSRRFNVATQDILEWNDLPDRHVLKAGENLTLHIKGDEKG
ncbi:MAG: LysM peptidoglycan-binding domain-containing protein [Desulfuromonadaceae bacterium]|nr:LysM peptidoglycan-binding domain-containing protein [Desulfuromonadaceae bacterium]